MPYLTAHLPTADDTDVAVLPVSDSEPVAQKCDICEHAAAAHDPIAARFCAATMEHALSRHCICR